MRTKTPLKRLALGASLLTVAAISLAQGPPGRDPYNPPPGHGGVPPGQAKKYGYEHMPPGHEKYHHYDEYHFRNEDRGRFYAHYRGDADRWRGRRRPVFVTGRAIPAAYVVHPVPQSYWVGAPPPPPGYRYGYYGGYVVAYNPTTRIVADVMDLVEATTSR